MKPILVPTDFSDAAFHAARYAWRLARDTGSVLHLLNVYHIPNPIQVLPIELIVTTDELKSDTESALKQMAEELRKSEGEGVSIQIASRNGDTAEEVRNYATFIGAGLIVTGMKGKGAVASKIIGNTALKLMQQSNVPVLGIPADTNYHFPERLLFASDGKSVPHPDDIQLMAEIVHHGKGKLFIGCVLSPHDLVDKDTIIEKIDPAFGDIPREWRFRDDSDEVHGLEQMAHALQADWLVMLPHPHSAFSRLFQTSHTRQIALHAGTPILTARS